MKQQTYSYQVSHQLNRGFHVPLSNPPLEGGITLLELSIFLSRGFHFLNCSIRANVLQHAIHRKNHKV